jgi:hypothetical protein
MTSDETITSDADESLIVLVRKLLDKAEATQNAHEADAFARKAAELVARHRIEPSRLRGGAQGSGEDLAIRDISIGRGAYVRGRLALLDTIARYHDVRVVFTSTPTGTVAHAAGFTSDLDVVEMLYQSLHTQVAAQMAEHSRATAAATQQFRRSFLFGFADRLDQVLADVRRSVRSQATETHESASSTDLALRERNERVDEFLAQSFGRIRTARRAGAAQIGGFSAGAAAAERADVGRLRIGGRREIGPGG